MSNDYKLVGINDKKIYAAVKKIAKNISGDVSGGLTDKVEIKIGNAANINDHEVLAGTFFDINENKDFEALLNLNAKMISSVKYHFTKHSHILITREENSNYKLSISIINRFEHATNVAKELGVIFKHFRPYIFNGSDLKETLGEELNQYYIDRHHELNELRDLAVESTEKVADYRISLDKSYDKKTADLECSYSEKRVELDDEYKEKAQKLKNESLKIERGFITRQQELDEIEKSLDNLDSKSTRRQIRKDIKADIEANTRNFSLSDKTIGKRQLTHCLFIVMISFFIINLTTVDGAVLSPHMTWFTSMFIIYPDTESIKIDPSAMSLSDIAASNLQDKYITTLRTILFSIGLIGTIIYYIRWQDNWFRSHADEEFKLKTLSIDIDRASWVVEMAREWKDETDQDIPDILIDRLTKNLFEKNEQDDAPKHPSEDALSTLVKAGSGFELDTPFGKICFNKSAIRKLKKEADKMES